MNEGVVASAARPAAASRRRARVMAVARDLELAALTGGAPARRARLSTARAVDALRDAKRRGLAVTGETAPHYSC